MIEIEDEIENTGGVSPRLILGSFIVVAVGLAVVLGLLLSDGGNDSVTSPSPVPTEEVAEETVETVEEESVSTPKTRFKVLMRNSGKQGQWRFSGILYLLMLILELQLQRSKHSQITAGNQ